MRGKSSDDGVTRRKFLSNSAALASGMVVAPTMAMASAKSVTTADLKPLHPPKDGPIKVAFLLSEGFQVIDFSGPWDVFSQVNNPATNKSAFELFTVAETTAPIRGSGGLRVVPDYDFGNAPQAHVIVVPAQAEASEPWLEWLRHASKHTQLTMSVCSGAFLLAKAGLLKGKSAATFHGQYKMWAVQNPTIPLVKGVRFVDHGNVATSGGLSAGIDLALHVVARYFGYQVADETAAWLEYAGYGWKNPHDTGDIFKRVAKTQTGVHCPVCDFGPVGDKFTFVYKGSTYFFCSEDCRQAFMKSPEKYIAHRQ